MHNHFKRCLAAILAFSLLSAIGQPAVYAAGGETADYILSFVRTQDAERFLSRTNGAQAVGSDPTLVTAQLTAREAAALRQSDNIDALERDVLVHANGDAQTASPSDTEKLYWNALAVGADEAHAQGYTGKGVRVAVLDSGLDVYSEVLPDGGVDLVDEQGCGDDETGHGTAVTGILAAPIDGQGVVGVAPDAALYNVRVLDAHNEAPVSRVLAALDWCIAQQMDIVNMSFGTARYSALLADKICEAAQAGILLVASVGNGDAVEYPAKLADVVAVASVDSGMTPVSGLSDAADLAAPGENVYTDSLLGGYGAFCGTSVAAPHVAGAAAVLLSKAPACSPAFLRAWLAASAKPCGVPDLGYALAIYSDLAQSFADGGAVPPQNPEPADDYAADDVFVAGSWSSAGHNALADNGFGSIAQNIRFPLLVKRVSASVDTNMSEDKLLHASGNYIAAAGLLFGIAQNYKTKGFGAFTHTNFRRDLVPILGESNYNTLLSDVSRALTLHGALDPAVSDEDRRLGATDFASVSEKASAIVFGMFFHLLGDVYAHRTIVPTTSIQTTTAVSHGSGTGGNSGLYFVKSDFNADCGTHTPDRTAAINAQYRETLSQLQRDMTENQGLFRFFAIVKWLGFLVLGKWILSMRGVDVPVEEQMQLDEALLQNAVNLPSNATHGRMCGAHSSCYGALTRLAGMGVLQFKDVKYCLRGMDAYAENGTKSGELRDNWSYYEDQAPSNGFYTRRFLLAKAVTQYYCALYASTGSADFPSYYLLSEPYGESVSKYCLKLDQYYNYLVALDETDELLTRAFWQNKSHSLFCYTTIVYEGTYFIDASTYPDAYGKPIYSGVFPVRTDGKTADSFYR